MAKAKVSSSKASYDTSECSSYESDSKVSYAKLASRQQDELDSLSKTIKKSEVLLIDEIEKGQTLTNEHEALKLKFEDLQSRHDLLSADHEKLTYEFLQRKVALENLKEAHEDFESVNLSLMSQQGSEAKPVSDSPCLTYLERSNTDSRGKAPMFPNATNAFDEENPAITEELLRLQDLFESP